MEQRTVQRTLRSLALRTACTAISLDIRLVPGAGSTALLAFQLDGLLRGISELHRCTAADLEGQVAPGAGQHTLGALAEAVPISGVEDVFAGPAFSHTELREVLGRLSDQLAAGQQIDGLRLLHDCRQLHAAVRALRAGGAL